MSTCGGIGIRGSLRSCLLWVRVPPGAFIDISLLVKRPGFILVFGCNRKNHVYVGKRGRVVMQLFAKQ